MVLKYVLRVLRHGQITAIAPCESRRDTLLAGHPTTRQRPQWSSLDALASNQARQRRTGRVTSRYHWRERAVIPAWEGSGTPDSSEASRRSQCRWFRSPTSPVFGGNRYSGRDDGQWVLERKPYGPCIGLWDAWYTDLRCSKTPTARGNGLQIRAHVFNSSFRRQRMRFRNDFGYASHSDIARCFDRTAHGGCDGALRQWTINGLFETRERSELIQQRLMLRGKS
jgi:hypothetical protein